MEKGNNLMSPIRKESVVQQIINKITDAIISGELKPGDKLPTEMEMVSAYHVGRNTVREAVRTLEAYGVVEIRRPEGTFVCDGFSDKIINPMLYSIILQKEDSYKDLIGLRQMIETGVLRMLQEQGITDEESQKIEKLYDELVKRINMVPHDVNYIADADMELHKQFALSTHNSLVFMVHNVVAELTRESRCRSIQNIFAANDKEYLIRTHREQIDAIKSQDYVSLDEVVAYSYIYWKDSIK